MVVHPERRLREVGPGLVIAGLPSGWSPRGTFAADAGSWAFGTERFHLERRTLGSWLIQRGDARARALTPSRTATLAFLGYSTGGDGVADAVLEEAGDCGPARVWLMLSTASPVSFSSLHRGRSRGPRSAATRRALLVAAVLSSAAFASTDATLLAPVAVERVVLPAGMVVEVESCDLESCVDSGSGELRSEVARRSLGTRRDAVLALASRHGAAMRALMPNHHVATQWAVQAVEALSIREFSARFGSRRCAQVWWESPWFAAATSARCTTVILSPPCVQMVCVSCPCASSPRRLLVV